MYNWQNIDNMMSTTKQCINQKVFEVLSKHITIIVKFSTKDKSQKNIDANQPDRNFISLGFSGAVKQFEGFSTVPRTRLNTNKWP